MKKYKTIVIDPPWQYGVWGKGSEKCALLLEIDMGQVTIECEVGKVSDGYHTFDELYDHRCHLFVALMRSNPEMSWRANNHEDGTMFEGWFLAGMHLPTGDISYHLPVSMWTLLDGKGIATSNKGPEWDGHTAADTVARLAAWCG